MGRFRDLAQGYRPADAADRQPAPDAPQEPQPDWSEGIAASSAAAPAAVLSTADHDAGEAASLAQHYAAEPDPAAPHPTDPDPLRDGLHDGYYLHRDAHRLRCILVAGGSARWCPSGALDMTKPGGGTLSYSPATAARLLAAGLLPADLAHKAPRTTRNLK